MAECQEDGKAEAISPQQVLVQQHNPDVGCKPGRTHQGRCRTKVQQAIVQVQSQLPIANVDMASPDGYDQQCHGRHCLLVLVDVVRAAPEVRLDARRCLLPDSRFDV